MIILHHFGRDGSEFTLNSDLIRSIDRTPDTLILLVDGDRIPVAESPEEIVDRIAVWRRRCAAGAIEIISRDGAEDAARDELS
jgi:flagellar protein FlbD